MAEAGNFLTTVLYKKQSKGKKYLICDGGSNFHGSSAFLGRFIRNNYPMYILGKKDGEKEKVNVVGPLCTPTDVIGKDIALAGDVAIGDCIVIEMSGAYGLTYSPCLFLSHKMPLEILYDGEQFIDLNKEEFVINHIEEMNLLIARKQDILILRKQPDEVYLK